MLRPIVVATLVAGTLDILSAFVFAGIAGMTPMGVLQFVASGPFGDAPTATPGWAAVGLAVHFAIMACMVAAYMIVAPRFPALLRHPRSEEHTSDLQSLMRTSYAVFCLKKNTHHST